MPKRKASRKNLKWLILELTKREGKRRQINVADMSEVVSRLVDLCGEYPLEVLGCLFRSAAERHGKKVSKSSR